MLNPFHQLFIFLYFPGCFSTSPNKPELDEFQMKLLPETSARWSVRGTVGVFDVGFHPVCEKGEKSESKR